MYVLYWSFEQECLLYKTLYEFKARPTLAMFLPTYLTDINELSESNPYHVK